MILFTLGEISDSFNVAPHNASGMVFESVPFHLSYSSKWTTGIYLICYITLTSTFITGNLSLDYMNDYLDPDGKNAAIDRVAVYKTPLESNSIGKKILNMAEHVYNAFVYLQVKDRYVSLDKHTDLLTIQISKEKGCLR